MDRSGSSKLQTLKGIFFILLLLLILFVCNTFGVRPSLTEVWYFFFFYYELTLDSKKKKSYNNSFFAYVMLVEWTTPRFTRLSKQKYWRGGEGRGLGGAGEPPKKKNREFGFFVLFYSIRGT